MSNFTFETVPNYNKFAFRLLPSVNLKITRILVLFSGVLNKFKKLYYSATIP